MGPTQQREHACLRDLQTGEGSVRLEFVVPQDAAASGAVDRLIPQLRDGTPARVR